MIALKSVFNEVFFGLPTAPISAMYDAPLFINFGLNDLCLLPSCVYLIPLIDDNGEEMEMLLYNAMQDNNVEEFKVNWKLEELDSNWIENEVNLIDEDDGFDLDYYEI